MADENSNGNIAKERWDARRMVRIERLKDAVSKLTGERDQAAGSLAAAIKERDEARAALSKADNSTMSKRVRELEALVNRGAHEKVFAKLAKAAGADPDAIEYLHELSGTCCDGDAEPDEEAISAALEDLKSRPGIKRLFGELDAQKGQDEAPVSRRKAPGSGQGKSEDRGTPEYTEEQLRDPGFALRNYDKIVEAAQRKIDRGLA